MQVNEGVREKENSDRLEWLQTHVMCDGLEEQLIFNSLTNSLGPRKLLHYGILHKVTYICLGISKTIVPWFYCHTAILLQSKSGKELVGFLTNDFLLFVQPMKSLNCQQFSFERNEHQKFKMYRKVCIWTSEKNISRNFSHNYDAIIKKLTFVADISQRIVFVRRKRRKR